METLGMIRAINCPKDKKLIELIKCRKCIFHMNLIDFIAVDCKYDEKEDK